MSLKIVFALQQNCPLKGWHDWLYFGTEAEANDEKERHEKIKTKTHFGWRVEETIIEVDEKDLEKLF